MGQKFHPNRSISHSFRDKCIFAFYAEIQDSLKMVGKLLGMTPVDCADTLWVINFVKTALSCTDSDINAFLRFTQKFKMAGKQFWEKSASGLCIYPMGQKFR